MANIVYKQMMHGCNTTSVRVTYSHSQSSITSSATNIKCNYIHTKTHYQLITPLFLPSKLSSIEVRICQAWQEKTCSFHIIEVSVSVFFANSALLCGPWCPAVCDEPQFRLAVTTQLLAFCLFSVRVRHAYHLLHIGINNPWHLPYTIYLV